MIMCWRNSLFGQWQNVNDCKVHVIAGGQFYTNIYTTLFTFYMHDIGRNIKKQTNKNVIFNLLVNILTPICSRHVNSILNRTVHCGLVFVGSLREGIRFEIPLTSHWDRSWCHAFSKLIELIVEKLDKHLCICLFLFHSPSNIRDGVWLSGSHCCCSTFMHESTPLLPLLLYLIDEDNDGIAYLMIWSGAKIDYILLPLLCCKKPSYVYLAATSLFC